MNAPVAPKVANKLKSTRMAGKLVNDYWEMVWRAKEEGKLVCWYEGSSINPFLEAADIVWVHGEAYSAMLAARHQEGPAQAAAEERGYLRELCSYARTHLGCAVNNQRNRNGSDSAFADVPADEDISAKLPPPDMIISAYAYCSTGQQWDEMTSRMFGKKVPIFNVSIPWIWASGKDAGYLRGQEWEETSRYVARQLEEMVKFIEEQTKKPYPWDRLRELMRNVKRASELRLEAMDMCTAKPAPATLFDWSVSIAPINQLPCTTDIVDYFTNVRDEVAERVRTGESAVPREKYRLFFDGIMNWNKLGWLAEKFARYDAAVVAGRYTHMAFWQEPDLIDPNDPVMGMGQNYLICPNNHSSPILIDLIMGLCEKYEVDGIVFHATRTCRAFTNPMHMIAEQATSRLGIQTAMFEGDVADESFYKDELLNTRVEAMLEAIDSRRMAVA